MGRLATLKRFARSRLAGLDLELPVFSWENTDDPVRMNAIFPSREWELDSPVAAFTQGRRDWIHWFLCDPSQGTYLEIYFERFPEEIATVWAMLEINDRRLVLSKAFYRDNSSGHAYSAGGVRLECNAPMRGWRLVLNVLMEEPATGSEVHVRVGAQVAMVGHTLELPKQLKSSFLARRFENTENLTEAKLEISKCCTACQAISQPVSVIAEIALDGQKEELMLFGSRLKYFGDSNLLKNVRVYIGYAENGTTFTAIHAGKKAYGYCCNPAHYTQPIGKTRWLSELGHEGLFSMRLNFEAAKFKYELDLGQLNTKACDEVRDGSLLAGGESFGLMRTLFTCCERMDAPGRKIELGKFLEFPHERNASLLLNTSDAACKDPKLTGGKGSSLAVLTEISNHLRTFTVPPAVVLTVNAYSMFAETPEVSRAIEDFLDSIKMVDMTALKIASDKCVSAISNVVLPEAIQKLLTDKLHESFGALWYLKKFAVRSSAVGEDSEEMSAAGQMTTYLGMRGERAILSAVVKCWASQFALTAVNYKRQYGQPLNSSMAVVVQEMVSADCAGVMFTCDPVTSHPSGIFITANFGLGESVVSATADPDTYALRRVGSRVVLETKSCGAKDSMVVEADDGRGTTEIGIEPDKKRVFCLTDERAIEIASIGAALADITDSPRDIEWAVVRGKVYLLQSRPVTSFFRESDFEIRHDYNSGFYTNREILSRANLDEVMPGAFSTLGVSIFGYVVLEVFGKKKAEWGKSDPSQFVYLSNIGCGKRAYMNFSQHGFARNKAVLKVNGITAFGYDISEHEALKEGIAHPMETPSAFAASSMILNALRSLKPLVKEMRWKAEQFRIDPPKDRDALSLFLNVLRHVPKLHPFMNGLIEATMPSAVYNMLTLNTLKSSQGAEDFSPELMILLSKVLRSDLEVESANIPKELTELSNSLRDDPNAGKFVQWTPEEALVWLETDDGPAARRFRVLRSKHAHRCYKEFDIHSKTWDIDPIPLVQTLQSTARSPEPGTLRKDDDSMTVDQLPKRPSLFQRAFLKFLIPRAQYAIYAREAAKSAFVKCIHTIRLAIRAVGLQMRAEGKLPEPELIFFLSCDEIYRLLTSGDPSLLPKALRRQKLHPVLDREIFPVLFCGLPKPIDSDAIHIDPNAESMEGVPVSEGVITGPARVILNFLTEAHLIERGEILVTRATDTGWTPYFPLLGGVVTEVGGLLSHGAVVAREYGLPAIVGVAGVTEFVKSGDIVTLDGNRGILRKALAQPSLGAVALQGNEQQDRLGTLHGEQSDGNSTQTKPEEIEGSEPSTNEVIEDSLMELEKKSFPQGNNKANTFPETGDTVPLIR